MIESEVPPSLKRLRLDDPDDTLGAAHEYPAPDVSPWRKNPRFAHRMHLYGRATKNNAANAAFFSKNTTPVYQFVNMAEPVLDNIGVLLSCTFHCGICGQGKCHWARGGPSRGSTTNMNRHMKDHHNTIWSAAQQADDLAASRVEGKGLPAGIESSVLTLDETFIDVFYKKLTRWIVMGNHPFTEVKNEEFHNLLFFLKPGLCNHLDKADALQDCIFIQAAITASWITDQWVLKETLINFRELWGAHTGQNMAEEVTLAVSELGIENKVLALNTNVHDHAYSDSTFTEGDAKDVVANDDFEAHEANGVIDPMVNLKSAIDKICKIS
ncbi:hypothetical protein B0J17DRAFT_634260 [Rhizoctonia solani]|nr:hypothetical protein B0J17DRAFT_634260 [Rhizoctonia solani]